MTSQPAGTANSRNRCAPVNSTRMIIPADSDGPRVEDWLLRSPYGWTYTIRFGLTRGEEVQYVATFTCHCGQLKVEVKKLRPDLPPGMDKVILSMEIDLE
ncbi:unnamed protein product [Amoebophrya sp. A25]|nr:unnamed protein product [Amoebophrya sp. A25]|eukprot:GSA25T00022768001.1